MIILGLGSDEKWVQYKPDKRRRKGETSTIQFEGSSSRTLILFVWFSPIWPSETKPNNNKLDPPRAILVMYVSPRKLTVVCILKAKIILSSGLCAPAYSKCDISNVISVGMINDALPYMPDIVPTDYRLFHSF